MRRLIIALAVGATGLALGLVLGLGAGLSTTDVAYADGGVHSGNFSATTDGCGGCHRAHTAQADHLLGYSNPTTLCLSCHDGTGADLDVIDGVRPAAEYADRSLLEATLGNPLGPLRGGGFVYARINENAWPGGVVPTSGASVSADCGTIGLGATGTYTTYSLGTTTTNGKDNICRTLPASVLTTGMRVTSAHIKGSLTNGRPGGSPGTNSWDNGLSAQNILWGYGSFNSGDRGNSGKSIGTAGNPSVLTCVDCHDPHGEGTYRILRKQPKVDAASGGSFQVTTSVTLWDVPPAATGKSNKVYTVSNYWTNLTDARTGTLFMNGTATVTANGPGQTLWQDGPAAGAQAATVTTSSKYIMADWCAQCHTRYKAGHGAGGTSSGDAVFNYRHASDGHQQVQTKSGPFGPNANQAVSSVPVGGYSFTAECLQCHVSHGSNAIVVAPGPNDAWESTNHPHAAFIPWPDGTAREEDLVTGVNYTQTVTVNGTATVIQPVSESGESALLKIRGRGTCVACHGADGGSFVNQDSNGQWSSY